MIPKIINYIWLGGKKKGNLANACIVSWKEKNQDYIIKEWNEKNLPLENLCLKNKFLRECKKRKLWAFMADYLRLYILYHYGGIYVDLDVMSIKSFDECLDNSVFFGYEYFSKDDCDKVTEGTGVIGCEPGNEFIKKCLDYYDDEIRNTDVYYIPTIFSIIKRRFPQLETNIYSVEYFAPYDYNKQFDLSVITNKTIAIHWFEGSWTLNKNIGLFLKVKHIKSPFKKKIHQFKNYLSYLKHKYYK